MCINQKLVPSQTQGTQGVPVVLTEAAWCDFAAPLVLVPRAQPMVKFTQKSSTEFTAILSTPCSHLSFTPMQSTHMIQILSVNHFSSKAKFSVVFLCLFLICYYWDFNNYCSILHPVFFIDFFLQRQRCPSIVSPTPPYSPTKRLLSSGTYILGVLWTVRALEHRTTGSPHKLVHTKSLSILLGTRIPTYISQFPKTHPASRTPFMTRPKSLKANFPSPERSALIEIWNYKYFKSFAPENPSPRSSSQRTWDVDSVRGTWSHDWPWLTRSPEWMAHT